MQTQNTAKRKKGILKRGLILAAACALALSVTACGGIEGKTSKESTNSSSSSSSQKDAGSKKKDTDKKDSDSKEKSTGKRNRTAKSPAVRNLIRSRNQTIPKSLETRLRREEIRKEANKIERTKAPATIGRRGFSKS